MRNYSCEVTLDFGDRQSDRPHPFRSVSDEEAVRLCREYRVELANAYFRGDLFPVRVRVLSLELGDAPGLSTTSRQLWDSWEDR